jgi:hypothetical protein
MRQQELGNSAAYEIVEAPLPLVSRERAQPASAVSDMPIAAGTFLVLSYASLMGAFALTIHGARADFAIVIDIFYLAMFFGLPVLFLAVEGDRSRRPSLGEFLERGIDTATGRLSGGGALVQMLVVPVLLAFAILAMGITYLLV